MIYRKAKSDQYHQIFFRNYHIFWNCKLISKHFQESFITFEKTLWRVIWSKRKMIKNKSCKWIILSDQTENWLTNFDYNKYKWTLNISHKLTCEIWKVIFKIKKSSNLFDSFNIIIIIINSYILMTSIKSTHERLYAICFEWTKLSEIENHSQSIWLLHAVETVSFETMYQICSCWLYVKE